MKLNPFEKKLVQHPIRFWLQNHVEAPLLTSMMPKPMARCERALEIGCGFGNGIQLIREHFGAGHITAVDIDPEMVAAAQSRWQARPQGSIWCLILPYSTIFQIGRRPSRTLHEY